MKGFISLSRSDAFIPMSVEDFMNYMHLKKSDGLTGYIYHSRYFILQYIEGTKERIDAHIALMNTLHKFRKMTFLSRYIVYLRFSDLMVSEYCSATSAERMFNENLIFQLKKLKKIKPEWFGLVKHYFYSNSMWNILDQLSEIYKYLLLPQKKENFREELHDF